MNKACTFLTEDSTQPKCEIFFHFHYGAVKTFYLQACFSYGKNNVLLKHYKHKEKYSHKKKCKLDIRIFFQECIFFILKTYLVCEYCSSQHKTDFVCTDAKLTLLTLLNFAAVPSAPEGPLKISEITDSSVQLSWKPPNFNGGLQLTAYVIERRDRKRATWMSVDKVFPNITTYCIQNLMEGNEYYFRVFAENEEGLSEPLESLEPAVPTKPQGYYEV